MNQDIKTDGDLKPGKDFRLYSLVAINIATFFGGPLAAGILVRQNFINLGKELAGRNALIIGIVSTVLLFVGIFSIPEEIIDRIPNVLIPTVYAAIIYFIVEKYQGQDLTEHKESNSPFYSGWRAAGIGGACTVVMVVGILAYVFLLPGDFDFRRYDKGIAEFQKKRREGPATLFDYRE